MSSDASSHILRAARLVLERAPAADAVDSVVETWGRYVVQLLDGLKDMRPDLLLLPEVISLIDLLQNRVDARRRVAWLVWGGNWLPGTVVKQCLSQLHASANDSFPPPPPEIDESAKSDTVGSDLEMEYVSNIPRSASPDMLTSIAKRIMVPNEGSSPRDQPTKWVRYADDTSIIMSEMAAVGACDDQPIKGEETIEAPLAPSYTYTGIQASSSDDYDDLYQVSCGIDFATLSLPEQLENGNVQAIKDASISIFNLVQLIARTSEGYPKIDLLTVPIDHERATLDLDLMVNLAHQSMVTGWVHVSAAATQMRKPACGYEAVLHIRARTDE